MTSVLTRAQLKQHDLNQLLMLAVQKGNISSIIQTIKLGGNVRYTDGAGNTLLHKAALPSVIKLLVRQGADINVKNLSGRTPVLHAITRRKCKRKYNALHGKLKHNHIQPSNKNAEDIIRAFLKCNANLNLDDRDGKSPLHAYVKTSYCNASVVLEMIEHGANVDAATRTGSTLLHAAIGKDACNVEVIKLLLRRGVNPNAACLTGETPLHTLLDSNYCKVEIVKVLIDNGADVGSRDGHGYTPLHFAVNNPLCTYEIVKAILMKDTSIVNKQNNQTGCTPLHVVLSFGQLRKKLKVIELLLEQGVLINAKDRRSFSHLHVAVDNIFCHESVIALLIKYGADVNARSLDGQTPLHFAFKKLVNFNVIKQLINSGADICLHDYKGQTPLFYAMSNPSFKLNHLVELLKMAKGIEHCLCKGGRGQDVLSLSLSIGKPDFTKVLLKYMLFKHYLNTHNPMYTKTMKNFFHIELGNNALRKELLLFVSDCLDEINNMLCDKITRDVSFYNLMKMDLVRLSYNRGVRNNIINGFLDRLNRNCYPIYKELSVNIKKEYILEGLSCIDVYSRGPVSGGKIILDKYSVCHIAKFLSNEELLDLVAAYSSGYNSRKKESKPDMLVELDFMKLVESKIQTLASVEIDSKSGCIRVSSGGENIMKSSLRQSTSTPEDQRVLRRSKRISDRSLSTEDVPNAEEKLPKRKKSLPSVPAVPQGLRRSKRISKKNSPLLTKLLKKNKNLKG